MFLKHLNLLRRRREALEKRFSEEFGVPFPQEEEGRVAIQDIVLNRLVELGSEVEAARVELKQKESYLSNPSFNNQGTLWVTLVWCLRASEVIEKKGKTYRELTKVVRRAGFPKTVLFEADRRAKEAGAEGGLIFRTG